MAVSVLHPSYRFDETVISAQLGFNRSYPRPKSNKILLLRTDCVKSRRLTPAAPIGMPHPRDGSELPSLHTGINKNP